MGLSFATRTERDMTHPPGPDLPITFEEGGIRFKYRIVGVALRDGKVLLHRRDQDALWFLPGGRPQLMESSEETLRREMREELGTGIDVHRLLWVVESFCGYRGSRYHQLALYFLISLPPESLPCDSPAPFESRDGGTRVTFRWFPLTELDGLPLYPSFLREALQDIPVTPLHVVHTDGDLPVADDESQ